MRFGLLYEAQRPFMQTETIPHERAMSSIETFGRHVMPAFRTESRTKPVATAVA